MLVYFLEHVGKLDLWFLEESCVLNIKSWKHSAISRGKCICNHDSNWFFNSLPPDIITQEIIFQFQFQSFERWRKFIKAALASNFHFCIVSSCWQDSISAICVCKAQNIHQQELQGRERKTAGVRICCWNWWRRKFAL